MLANRSTSCICECKCGGKFIDKVHNARLEVADCDKILIELRNSTGSEEDIQAAETARHAAQERLDKALEALIEFTKTSPLQNAKVDEEEGTSSEDENTDSDTDGGDESDQPIGNIDMFADDDDEDGESYVPDE
ncbi:hypothetical protein BDW22DRAFT_1421435 [Trametopsis cervina]|nr:hypothetical protein BDW22DRAFT_1421435 [Trametopsis cervina]